MNEPECVPTVSFSSETYVAAESAGSVEVCVILNIPYSFVLEFTVNARDIGSATAGVDFVGGKWKTNILPGSTDRCINITILNDNIALEENENFAVEIAMASVPSITSTAEIIITDSNVAIVELEETLYRVTEAGGSVQVCVRVGSPCSCGCPIASAFVVSLYTNDDDADSVTDYSAVTATLSFPPCSTLQCVTIAITDDSNTEPDESFSLIWRDHLVLTAGSR
ncbi:Extracellular matrix protein FRAS1 [Geodia barretti]|uniref:Extracellular matrix protein FRAS1 n=1 Tax=Geodia barretti TaxID=519541 RepID=A0AA35RKQ3_GEOBA|nr:Extracellular matrix protein FRAS1 [Geodia barretti]